TRMTIAPLPPTPNDVASRSGSSDGHAAPGFADMLDAAQANNPHDDDHDVATAHHKAKAAARSTDPSVLGTVADSASDSAAAADSTEARHATDGPDAPDGPPDGPPTDGTGAAATPPTDASASSLLAVSVVTIDLLQPETAGTTEVATVGPSHGDVAAAL